MKTVKVRRIGNSNMIAIPSEYEKDGYAPGASVMVDLAPDGGLQVLPTGEVRARVRDANRRIVAKRQETLRILADHDEETPDTTS